MPIKRFTENNPIFNAFQSEVVDKLRGLDGGLFNDAELIEDIDLNSTSATTVLHSLGREPRGYILVKSDSATDVYHENTSLNAVNLRSSATNVRVSIVVF